MKPPRYDTARLGGNGGMFADVIADGPPVSLADKFGVPPFSILDKRSGEWQARRRAWLALGIDSEIGRGESLVFAKAKGTDPVSMMLRSVSGGTSVFDPVLCELVYRWYTAPGASVLDPFAGGSVRGIVAAHLGRYYTGLDIRHEQIAANYEQADACTAVNVTNHPHWITADATTFGTDGTVGIPAQVDLVFSCPPYADLEIYSDDPRDISTWPYNRFAAGHAAAITAAVDRLRDDRYACWVIGDVRDKRTGTYRGLVAESIRRFTVAGCSLLNEHVIIEPVFGAALRAERPFLANRKATKVHQTLLVFVKGDVKRAATWAGTEPEGAFA